MSMEFLKAQDGQLFSGRTPILLRGFGLGGWLLPEGYMWKFYTKCDRPRKIERLICELCGRTYAEKFWQAYYSRYITKDDIRFIAGQGFNSVRLPINARHYHEHLPFIDALVDWCREYGIYVILDMHAAPGGQTGQNIDDSENDLPELFTDEKNRQALIALWREIAERYRDEPVVAGYDLLNEPLPNWFSRYNPLLMPLYDELIAVIREVDNKHLIILEGAHWASDFSVFGGWLPPDGETNLLIQFHKYWNSPDKASIEDFLAQRERLHLPLFMGEGGENNTDWYVGAFSLFERLGISWSFWSYKKMDNTNSPVSFPVPPGWQHLLKYLDGGRKPTVEESVDIFDGFLEAITAIHINKPVLNALNRQAPLTIPCEFYDEYNARKPRPSGADLNRQDAVNIQFADGHTGVPDYKRYGGEPQPESENLVVILERDEWLEYQFRVTEARLYKITVAHLPEAGTLTVGCGELSCIEALQRGAYSCVFKVSLLKGLHTLRLSCTDGRVVLDTVSIN